VGGISVLTNLDPYVVGLHFVISVVLVVLSTMLVYRVYDGRRGTVSVVPRWYIALAWAASLLVAITIAMGILTTGSGPHAGDAGAARNGLDSEFLQHIHSWPAYAAFAATILLLLGALRLRHKRLVRFTGLLLAVEVAQIAVGLTQARLGLPEILVGTHMVLACCLAAAMTAVVLSLREPRHPEAG
jgi:cytochrome c oxidase assembly protein subunit 15